MTNPFALANVQLEDKPSVTETEAKMIWSAAKKPAYRMLIMTLWYAGLRIGEALLIRACDLRRVDLDFTLLIYTEKLKETKAKGRKRTIEERKPDELPIPRLFGLDLNDYIKNQGIHGTDRVFPFTRVTAWRAVQKAARDAGLPNWRDIHPHSFRHGFIYDKAGKNVHPYVLSKLARHRDLKTTLGYYHPTEKDLRQAMEQ